MSDAAALRIADQRITEAAAQPDRARLHDLEADLDDTVSWLGDAPELDVDRLRHAQLRIEQMAEDEAGQLDLDQIEGKAACVLYEALVEAGTPTEALSEAGFWRYVSLVHMWNFCVFRQPSAFKATPEPRESHKQYIDGEISYLCVPSRMYLRVTALGGRDHAQRDGLAWAVRGGTDFWRSHIHRVRVGEHPAIVRAMVRRQSAEETRLSTLPLRTFAKELNRTLTNLVPSLLDDEDADRFVRELWERRLREAPADA